MSQHVPRQPSPCDPTLWSVGPGLSAPDWESALGPMRTRIIQPNTRLLSPGDPATQVVLLRTGLVKLLYECSDGRTAIVGLRSAGWMLGASQAITGGCHAIAAVTVTSCDVCLIGAADLRARAQSDARVAWRLATLQSRETANALGQIACLNCLPAMDRLETFLTNIAMELKWNGVPMALPLRDWEVAQLIAVTPQYMCILTRELQRKGRLIRQGTKWLVVPTDHASGVESTASF